MSSTSLHINSEVFDVVEMLDEEREVEERENLHRATPSSRVLPPSTPFSATCFLLDEPEEKQLIIASDFSISSFSSPIGERDEEKKKEERMEEDEVFENRHDWRSEEEEEEEEEKGQVIVPFSPSLSHYLSDDDEEKKFYVPSDTSFSSSTSSPSSSPLSLYLRDDSDRDCAPRQYGVDGWSGSALSPLVRSPRHNHNDRYQDCNPSLFTVVHNSIHSPRSSSEVSVPSFSFSFYFTFFLYFLVLWTAFSYFSEEVLSCRSTERLSENNTLVSVLQYQVGCPSRLDATLYSMS